jgi:hypothetical protein
MRKFFFLVLTFAAITGCKKDASKPVPTIPPTAITYAFSASQNDTYTIRYTDTNKTLSTQIITGKNWSKSIKMAYSPNAVNLMLYVESTNKSFDASGNLSIAVQDRDTASMPLLSSAYTYGLRGQIIYQAGEL